MTQLVTEAVEAGEDIADPPPVTDDEASAVGDPHVTTMDGNKVDLDFRQEAAEAGEQAPVTVTIGASMRAQTRCATSSQELDCAENAGNRNIRVNRDYSWAGDSFRVTSEGNQVCATRLDNNHWGMNLQVSCPVKAPEASAVGDPHITTMDGNKLDMDLHQRHSRLPALSCE